MDFGDKLKEPIFWRGQISLLPSWWEGFKGSHDVDKMMTDVVNLTLVTLQSLFWADSRVLKGGGACQMKIIDLQQEVNVMLDSEEAFIIWTFFFPLRKRASLGQLSCLYSFFLTAVNDKLTDIPTVNSSDKESFF